MVTNWIIVALLIRVSDVSRTPDPAATGDGPAGEAE